MEKLEQTKQSLLDKIISDRNIYNAIYIVWSLISLKKDCLILLHR